MNSFYKKYKKLELIMLALVCISMYGWVMNIVYIYNYTGEFNSVIILRYIGIIVSPLGSVLGFV